MEHRSNHLECEILIPVFNGYESVCRCVESVLRYSPPDCRVRVLDDASTDLRLIEWLSDIESYDPRVSVVRCDENLGFVGNVNRGLSTAESDVILLNSDTVVTAGWVEKMRECAATDPRIGLVCPLSNNATILSVPVMNRDQPIPDGLGVSRFAQLIESSSARCYPRLPVAVGFCVLIRLAVIQRIGLLHRAYHRGYGEECDYSLRAWDAGYEVVCCDHAFVYHEGEQSFGAISGMDAVKRHNESVLLERWNFYNELIRRFFQINPLRDVQERILTGLLRERGDHSNHILQVLHSYHALGGTELHSRALAEGLAEDYRITLIYPDHIDSYQDYACVADHEWFRVLAYQRKLTEGQPEIFGHVAALRNRGVEASFARMLVGSGVDIVHFQHLMHWGTLELPLVAKRLGAFVLLSLHDYFLLCPVFDMLQPDGGRCEKARAQADAPDCLICLARQARANTDPGELSSYLEQRYAKLLEIFAAADLLIAPSDFVRDRFRRAYGEDVASKVRVMPHGIPSLGSAMKPVRGKVFRLGVFANLTRRKGADLLVETVAHLRRRGTIDIIQFGGVETAYVETLKQAGVDCRGVYRLQDLARLVSEVDLALVPSVYEETFCLTIAELQSLGAPVLAFAIGAIPERIQDGVTGFLVQRTDALALAERIHEIVSDASSLAKVRAGLRQHSTKTMAANIAEYGDLYAGLLAEGNPHPQDSLPALLESLVDDPPGEPIEMSAALIQSFDPLWGSGTRQGYGSGDYRRWLESSGRYEGPCYAEAGAASLGFLMVVMEYGRETGAIEATLDSLLGAAGDIRCLIVSPFDPPPLTQAHWNLCNWMRIEPGQLAVRLVNQRLASSRGSWIGWMVAGDRLNPAAARLLRGYIQAHPEWRFVYTDEDWIAEDGSRYRPDFKPDFDLDLLRSRFYLGALCLIHYETFIGCGGLSHPFSTAIHDLCLKIVDGFGAAAVGHIPHLLYHAADSRMGAAPAELMPSPGSAAKILVAHLERNRLRGRVVPTSVPGIQWIDYVGSSDPRITLLVMTCGDVAAVEALVEPVRRKFEQLDVLVLDVQRKGARHGPSRLASKQSRSLRWLRAVSGENLAKSLNQAIKRIRTDRVLVAHDGLSLHENSGLEMLVGLIDRADVALAGPCILDHEGRILQGPHLMGFWPLGATGQVHRAQFLTGDGRLNRHLCIQGCASVSDQAFMLWRPAFERVGGFNADHFPNAWYLLDLSLRLSELGYKTLWTPHSTLIAGEHAGSFQSYRRHKSRDLGVADEVARLYEHWLPRLARDAAYNPNLTLRKLDAAPEAEIAHGWDPILCRLPRVLGFPGDLTGSGHYRVIDPLNALRDQELGCCALMLPDRSVRPPSVVELERLAPDALILHNALHDRHLHAMQLYASYHSAQLMLSLDDLITDLPDWNPFSRSNYADIERRLRQALSCCDRLLVSTPALAECYASWHADVRIVPNRLSRARWSGIADSAYVPGSVSRKPRIGWAGAAQHAADLEWLAPVVEALSAEAEWYFFGMCPDGLKPFATQILPMVDFDHYPTVLAKLDLDIAIAPLVLHDFNRCKSNLKLLEYGALGIPVVCTDIEPYRGAPVERLPNSPRAWIDALRARVADLESASREGAELRRWVESDWILDDTLSQWVEVLSPRPS